MKDYGEDDPEDSANSKGATGEVRGSRYKRQTGSCINDPTS